MSAICGAIGTDGREWTAADLEPVMGVLAPLGRDGGGVWAGTAGRCGVALAAALRHSTPEDAADRQPAEWAEGSLVMVGDVRVDNRAELAALLRVPDARSVPDSTFVLAAYERWGDRLFDRVIGDFAFAIADRLRGGVLIARDHVGARPLVIHERRGVVAFASNAIALARLEGIGHVLDRERAAEVLGLVYDSERTFVERVRSVPPATALWVDGSGARQWRWWNPDPRQVTDLGSPAAHERELREAFEAAVAARLRTTGRVGATVSGGLDSSSAAATAARLLAPGPVRTYTSAPQPGWKVGERPGWDADESPLVRELAALHPNMEPAFVHIEPGGSMFDLHEPLWELGAGPIRNPCNALWVHAIHARAGSEGVTTLLSGARGNLCFSADGPDWLMTLVREGHIRAALREAAAWSRTSGEGLLYTLLTRLAHPLMPPAARRLARTVAGRPESAANWTVTTAAREEVLAGLDLGSRVAALTDRRGVYQRAVALRTVQIGASHADNIIAMAALTGAEERDPTVDRRVLEVTMRQPEWVRRHDGITRAVVRGAMADRLPPGILNRTRRGEQLPDWLDVMTGSRAEIAAELDQLVEHPLSRELVDTDRLRRLVARWPDRALRADDTVMREFRLALLRALVVSRYLRWFERRAPAP